SWICRTLLTPMYNCARIKLTAHRDGCKLRSMSVIIPAGGSHDQEQDSEQDTRISCARQIYSRHRDHLGDSQEYGAQVFAPSTAGRHASSATQSSLQAGSVQRAHEMRNELYPSKRRKCARKRLG